MLKFILTTTVALYAAFIIWGKPDATPAPAPAPEVATILGASDANFDEPVILSQAGQNDTVTSAAIAETVVPGAAAIAAATPAPDAATPRRIGDPVAVSIARPQTPAAGGGAAPEDADTDGLLRVSGSTVNMRSGPSTEAGVVASLPAGTLAEPVGAEIDGWIEIRDVASGLTGFMAARFLEPG